MALKNEQDSKDAGRAAARPLTNRPSSGVVDTVSIRGVTGPVAVVDTVQAPIPGPTATHDKPWFNDERKGPPTSFPSPPF